MDQLYLSLAVFIISFLLTYAGPIVLLELMTFAPTNIKAKWKLSAITLSGSLVLIAILWMGPSAGFHNILGSGLSIVVSVLFITLGKFAMYKRINLLPNSKKKLLSLVLINLICPIVMIPVAFILSFMSFHFYMEHRQYLTPIKFNQQQWKSIDRNALRLSERQCMLNDLFARNKLVGMSRNEVTNLLGPSQNEPSIGQPSVDYFVGIGIEPIRLRIHFGENGKVSRYEVVD